MAGKRGVRRYGRTEGWRKARKEAKKRQTAIFLSDRLLFSAPVWYNEDSGQEKKDSLRLQRYT